ncbi:TPA: antibiotic biosynthesis monooxygenase [Vibrio vulnificus]|nr:antibiotic biosynthesis monooxygenase [Vibrio vulnificus]
MSTINIIATLHVQNEVLDDVRSEMKRLVPLSLSEKGCIEYCLHEVVEGDIGVENTGGQFVVIEKWRDIESLNKHASSEHFTNFINNFSESELRITVQMIKEI